jgi:hypothetical protein
LVSIEYHIDHERRIVLAWVRGTLTDDDVFGYQSDLWSRPEVSGYNELIDMTDVEHIAMPSSDRVPDLAALSAEMDPPDVFSKFAIVAPSDLAFGLGRRYATYRELNSRSTKKVGVFRSMEAALAWLGMAE